MAHFSLKSKTGEVSFQKNFTRLEENAIALLVCTFSLWQIFCTWQTISERRAIGKKKVDRPHNHCHKESIGFGVDLKGRIEEIHSQ